MTTDERWGDLTANVLRQTSELAIDYLRSLPDRPVAPSARLAELRQRMGGPLPEGGTTAEQVVRELALAGEAGAMASAGPRFFGFVIGGGLPVALAADWLTSTWDQNATMYVINPAAAVAEETAAGWLLELFDLPRDAGVGFTTGCQMAHVVALAAARRHVLLKRGWDVDRYGLQGAPRVRVLAGAEVHVTVPRALQLLGLGSETMELVAADGQGRMRPDALAQALAEGERDMPTVVCAQVGNVNTGACDPMSEIADVVRTAGDAWLHVDGAFGLWARAVPELGPLVSGLERADSWASDFHKWLNVPYDSGLVVVRQRDIHRAAMAPSAAYLMPSERDERDPWDWVAEFSRRARGFPVYAALRGLGRLGVADMVRGNCALAARMAAGLSREPGVEVLNEVVLNQVLVRFGDDDQLTRDVIARVQADGTCWLSGSVWQDRAVMRVSVSNWSTTEEDADLSTDAILRCYRAARDGAGDRGAASPR